jgi:prophage antirepressor-like protein
MNLRARQCCFRILINIYRARHSDDQPSRNSSPAPESTAISPFNFEGKDVRMIADKDGGEPWFVARDVAAALGYAVPDKAVRNHCKGATDLVAPSAGGPQRVRAIREPDVYRLVMKSKLPSAGKFEKLVFEEILPSIRKTGRYEAPMQEMGALTDVRTLEFKLGDLVIPVRVGLIDGVEWFIARDVAEGMGYTWSGSGIDHVPHEWKGVTSVVTPRGAQSALALTEAGLNFFLNRSDKECAILVSALPWQPEPQPSCCF